MEIKRPTLRQIPDLSEDLTARGPAAFLVLNEFLNLRAKLVELLVTVKPFVAECLGIERSDHFADIRQLQ